MSPILRVPSIALLAFAALYAGDYLSARYRIPGNRQTLDAVQVQTLYATPQKDGRVESWLGDTASETCVLSLFPHLGYTPCWYLRRHPRRTVVIGRNAPRGQTNLSQGAVFAPPWTDLSVPRSTVTGF